MSGDRCESNPVSAKSSWIPTNDRKLTDAFVFTENLDSVTDIEKRVTAENCILLEMPNGEENENVASVDCIISISSQPKIQMTSISVLSDSRLIEIHGNHGEYLTTIKCSFIEEEEGMSVYQGDFKFNSPLVECQLKFLGLKSKSSLWLYGIGVNIREVLLTEKQPKIPFGAVDEKLSAMGVKLSDRAENFKKFFEQYQSMADGQNNQLNFAPFIAHAMGAAVLQKPPNIAPDVKYEMNTNCKNVSVHSLPENIEKRILEQMQQLENRMIEVIDSKISGLESRLMAKLDALLVNPVENKETENNSVNDTVESDVPNNEVGVDCND